MSLSTATLIIIDLQNDFLAANAPFAVHPMSRDAIEQCLSSLVPTFRAAGGHIIWIKSHYQTGVSSVPSEGVSDLEPHPVEDAITSVQPLVPVSPDLLWVLEGTHTGKKPCCQKGTPGAELVPWAAQLVQDKDSTIIKTYYSAFRQTRLFEQLDSMGIECVYLAGLLSNMCVLATALDGLRSTQLKITIIVDALAWRREISHQRALETFRQHGVELVESVDILRIAREY